MDTEYKCFSDNATVEQESFLSSQMCIPRIGHLSKLARNYDQSLWRLQGLRHKCGNNAVLLEAATRLAEWQPQRAPRGFLYVAPTTRLSAYLLLQSTTTFAQGDKSPFIAYSYSWYATHCGYLSCEWTMWTRSNLTLVTATATHEDDRSCSIQTQVSAFALLNQCKVFLKYYST